MLVRVGPRQSGRSSWAVEMMERNPHHRLVVFSEQEAKRLESGHMFLKGRVNTWNNSESLRGTHAPLIIDNVDILVREMFLPLTIDVVTIEGTLI